MRRHRLRTGLVGLLLAAGYTSALQLGTDVDNGPFQIAEAFASIPDENVTELLDEVAEREVVALPEESEPRDLRPMEASSMEHHSRALPVTMPYGGALVAVEATALLVGGATIVVLLVAKVKSRSAMIQYDYDEDYVDPMLQSLLYSDMDYAAI